MKKDSFSTLKEIRRHGTNSFPCAIYQTRAIGQGLFVKHHWHEEVEILYFSGGSFLLEINMEIHEIQSECFYFINPGELHSIFSKSSGTYGQDAIVFHMKMLSFEQYDRVQAELIQPILNGQLAFPRCISSEASSFLEIRHDFYEILYSMNCLPSEEFPRTEEAVTDDLTSQLYIKGSLLRILAYLRRENLFTFTEKHTDRRVESLKSVLTYIKENYREKLYVSNLASCAQMNEQYFCRFFKQAIGKSPMAYVNEYRIRQALKSLSQTDESVMDICLSCGFNNFGNFLREFRKVTGTTPLKYRKESLKKSK